MVAISLIDVSATLHSGDEAVPVLQRVSMRVAPGGLTVIFGRSGVGKTTLLRVIAGLIDPTGGSVSFEEESGAQVPMPTLGFGFQPPRLMNHRTILWNVAMPIIGPSGAFDAAKARAMAALRRFDIDHLADRRPFQCSSGQMARASLARATVAEPRLLLLDEPFSHLDEVAARQLRLSLRELISNQCMTTVLVTHNAAEAFYLGDEVLVIGGRPGTIDHRFVCREPHPRNYGDPVIVARQEELLQLLRDHPTIVEGEKGGLPSRREQRAGSES